MKLKDSFITHNLSDTQVMVNASSVKSDFHGLVKSNSTAAFIINQLKEDKTKKQLVDAVLATYEVDEKRATEAVEYVIEKLKEVGALE